ncbi:DUF6479 family protein [Streptomyces caniferus]|uniref:DUF6479 family protein n=1 Tax=Streptomyces caniferus TaxID=285557 RepID=A0A640S564_9ACTN|nr:DUF6479 family protein [Streptomyces caniferus]GFE06300.1 hypothetical protein Scani_25680 [Streptomyces caniferus]
MDGTAPTAQLAAAQGTSGVLFSLVGVVIVAVLLAAFVWGRRVKAREPGPPGPEEQPRLPEGGPVGDIVESREPDDLAPTDHRRTPHELKGNGTRPRSDGK